MKKTMYFWALAALVLGVVACNKENAQNEPAPAGEKIHLTVKAGFDESVTKTYLDGKKVKWSSTDEIGIIDALLEASSSAADKKAAVQKFTISELSADNATATFEGEIAPGLDKYYAAYPFDATDFVSASEGYVRLGFLSSQKASAPGTFDNTYNSSVALLKDGELNFKNLGGLLKFELLDDNVQSVTLKANDNGTIGGVYYVTLDDSGNITNETLGSGRTSMSLTPASGGTFAPGVYYFCLSARTYTGGITLNCALSDGPNKTVGTTEDVVVERSKITSVGKISTAVSNVEPVTFPVIFPMGYDATGAGYNAATNEWVVDWSQDAACVQSTRTSQLWTGHHGTLYSKDQRQAYMTWNWADAIVATTVKHFIETSNNAGYKISVVGVKGIWTGDYFEFVLPVKNFDAGTTLSLTMPIYTRNGPTFWEVKYLDGATWKTTATANLPAYPGAEVTATATWAIPFGGAAASATIDTDQTVEMTFDNAISQGEIKIRVICVDGSIWSTGENTVVTGKTGPSPATQNGTANAPFYFWNPGNRDNQAITIDIVNI